MISFSDFTNDIEDNENDCEHHYKENYYYCNCSECQSKRGYQDYDIRRNQPFLKGEPMPAKSRAQFRFMQAVAHGSIKKKGLSRKKAAEYVSGQSPKGLPRRVKRKK